MPGDSDETIRCFIDDQMVQMPIEHLEEQVARELPVVLPEWNSKSKCILDYFRAAAKEVNGRLFIAGGFVRDLVMGNSNNDIDLVIEGDIYQFVDKIKQLYPQIVSNTKTYETFLTATVTLKLEDSNLQYKIDVASVRNEAYPTPAVLPKVSRANSIREDCLRRGL
jgi:tRNA nucleotidyltransferase/poly(A) polymerase